MNPHTYTHIKKCDFFSRASGFPIFALTYSIGLTIMAAAVNAIFFNTLKANFDLTMANQIFNYLSLVVVWLVSERPVYGLTVHDLQVEEMETILSMLSDLLSDPKHENITDAGNMLMHICSVLDSCDEFIGEPPPVSTKTGKKILTRFRVFGMRRMVGIPNSIHGLTIGVVIGFHGVLAPLLLHESVGWFSLIPNFVLAVFTTGCLDVALKLLDPYSDVKTPQATGAVAYFQNCIHTLQETMKDLHTKFKNEGRRKGKNDPIPTIFKAFENQPMNVGYYNVHPVEDGE